jgi:rubrerythrin
MTSHADMPQAWSLDRVPWAAIDRTQIRQREDLFYLVAAASFIEIASELYTRNLMHYYARDLAVLGWLESRWEKDEVRHGRVLRDYVAQVWPEFDWALAYAGFLADYAPQCTVDAYEPTPALELIARCVVETGTSSFYAALAAQSPDPVLAGIALRIRADEINHYKHFLQFFRKYNAVKPVGRRRILGVLWRRALEARNGDADCALRHVYQVRQATAVPAKSEFRLLCAQLARQVRRHYPVTIAVKMLLKPLDLPAMVDRIIHKPLSFALLKILQ